VVQNAELVATQKCSQSTENVEGLPPVECGTHPEKTTAESVGYHAPEEYQGLVDLQIVQ